jgi:hypothetical protein
MPTCHQAPPLEGENGVGPRTVFHCSKDLALILSSFNDVL